MKGIERERGKSFFLNEKKNLKTWLEKKFFFFFEKEAQQLVYFNPPYLSSQVCCLNCKTSNVSGETPGHPIHPSIP